MYHRLPTKDELGEDSGLDPEDYALDPVDVWPANWEAFCLFADLETQWRVGIGGATGLDYTAVVSMMDLHEVPRERRRELLADLQVMEKAALKQMRVKYT